MKLYSLLKAAVASVALFWASMSLATNTPLMLDVYQADDKSFYVSSVLVTGKTEAVLIDAQFTRADAHNVVANILRSGKQLTTVYISHGDPDYYFGLEVVRQAFPDVKIYASEATLEHIKKTVQKKLDFWGPKLGANAPTNIVMPELLSGDTLSIDGERLQVVGLDKHPHRTFVWIPSIKAVVGGVAVFGKVHLWMADAASKEKRQVWSEVLDAISALKPKVVVPGHGTVDAPKTLASVEFSRKYLEVYEQLLSQHDNSEDLIKAVKQRYPNAVLPISLKIGAKVSTGEMKW